MGRVTPVRRAGTRLAAAEPASGDEVLPPEAWAAALASLPGMGPARLATVLRTFASADVWREIRAGTLLDDRCFLLELGRHGRDLLRAWREVAVALDVSDLWSRYAASGVGVAALGSAAFPAALATDIEPPGVLFMAGDPDVIAGPRVGIVGTRRCTRYGREVAYDLGRDLAAAGVGVVSGLAIGIDGAAHAGALAAGEGVAPPIAVVGSGLDVVYPPRHAVLWRRVREAGVVLSEAPLGAAPEPWRFPARNRLIAALADVIVVVESHERGGSMHTVAEAARRDRVVLAVPGPVRSAASSGTNRLLSEGAGPACDVGDVLVALGLSPGGQRRSAERRSSPDADDAAILDAVGWQPASLEQLVVRTGLPLPRLSLTVARLEARGWLARQGAWYERVVRDGQR